MTLDDDLRRQLDVINKRRQRLNRMLGVASTYFFLIITAFILQFWFLEYRTIGQVVGMVGSGFCTYFCWSISREVATRSISYWWNMFAAIFNAGNCIWNLFLLVFNKI